MQIIENQVCSVAQMKKLRNLGVKTYNSSMYWKFNGNSSRIEMNGISGNLKAFEERDYGIGAFTVTDIIDILPPRLEKKYMLIFYRVGHIYMIEYSASSKDNTLCTVSNESLIDAAYEMLLWYKTEYKQ